MRAAATGGIGYRSGVVEAIAARVMLASISRFTLVAAAHVVSAAGACLWTSIETQGAVSTDAQKDRRCTPGKELRQSQEHREQASSHGRETLNRFVRNRRRIIS